MRSTPARPRDHAPDAQGLAVRLPDGTVLRLLRPFYIGRDFDCEVQLQDAQVSRRHAQVTLERGQWSIRDLQSSNGLFVGDERVETAPIGEGITVRLGGDGPRLEIAPHLDAAPAPDDREVSEDSVIDSYVDRFTGSGHSDEDVGERTLMIRKAVRKIQRKQQRKYRWMIAAAASVAVAAAGYAYYTHLLLERWAKNTFYEMKARDVLIAEGEQEIEQTGNTQTAARVKQYMEQRRQMETNYEQYFKKLYDRRLSEKDRLILKITRLFGEYELAAPPEYIKEVTKYIEIWQSTSRYESALRRAQQGGYMKRIVTSFAARRLPPQYFYLAMQESSFVTDATGPPTRWGIARGMWQFIPETGRKYGLRIESDPSRGYVDDRLDWERATTAAARYIKDIYSTDAQASGLLVIASYNWGENRVIDIVRKMPQNPKERNFWALIANYRLPEQTYNYVFSIVSAAVIGENPRLFGFQFDNPLASVSAQ